MSWEFEFLYLLQALHHPVLDRMMLFLTTIGEAGMVWIAISLVLVCFPKTRRCGISMMISMVLTYVVGNLLLKNLVARPRPCEVDQSVKLLVKFPWDYSFPSGHTMNGFTAATTIFLSYKKAGLAAYVLAAAVAFSRMYLFVHFPTDVAGGILVGAAAAVMVYFAMKRVCAKRPEL